jgi:hypothetical protein
MVERSLSVSVLADAAGLSPNTVRDLIGEAEGTHSGNHRESSIIALTRPLGWPPGYLIKVRDGASLEGLANEVAIWSAMELALRLRVFEDPRKKEELLAAAASVVASVEDLLRIAREITGQGNPVA